MPGVFLRYEDGILTIPYTPQAAVAVGDVVVIGVGIAGICVRPIEAGKLGALNINGGVYIATGDTDIEAGVHVYWDAATKRVTEDNGGSVPNAYLGVCTKRCTDADEPIEFAHLPIPPVSTGS